MSRLKGVILKLAVAVFSFISGFNLTSAVPTPGTNCWPDKFSIPLYRNQCNEKGNEVCHKISPNYECVYNPDASFYTGKTKKIFFFHWIEVPVEIISCKCDIPAGVVHRTQ